MKPLLIYLQPWRTSTAARVDMRAGDCPAAEGFGIGGFEWEPIVTSRPVFSIELMSPDLDGKVQAGKVKLTLALRLVKNLPDALTLDYQGAPITIWSCDTLAWDRALVELTGTVTAARLDVDTGQVQIDAEVSTTLVEKPLLTLSFSGGGGLLGDTGKRGVLRPAGFGIVEYIEPVWFDETYNIGQIDGYGNTLSVQRVMEGANDLGASVGDYANYAALQAAIIAKTIPPGRWGTCLADGLIGMGAPPAGVIGVNATFGYGKPGSMMQRIVQFHAGVALGSIDTAAFTALTAQVEAVLGGAANIGYWTKDQRQVNDLLQAMAQSCNATPLVSFQGLVTVTRAVASAPVATLDRSGSVEPRVINWKSAQSDAPYFQLRARTARPARVLTRAEIFAEDDLNDKGPWNATTGYRLDNTVFGADGAEFIYINATPTVGPALPTSTYPPATMASNAYWQQLTRPPPLTGSQLGVADGATADLKLTDIGSQTTTIAGNTVTRNAGTGDYNACVRGSSIQGPQFAEMDIAVGQWNVFGLDDDATSFTPAGQLVRLEFLQTNGQWFVAINNVSVISGVLGSGFTGKLRLSYDGIRYRAYVNATQLGTDVAASASNLVLWPKWWAYGSPAYTGLRAAPYTANIWPDIDGPGKPADNAGTTVALTSLGTGTFRVIGNSYTKTATNAAFDTALRGPAMTGAIYCEMDINPSCWNMVAFDANAATYDRASTAFYAQYDPLGGVLNIYVAGTVAQNLTPGAGRVGKLTITDDGVRYRVFLAGAQVGTDVAAAAGLALYPKWFGYNAGTYTGLSAGQGAGTNLWVDVGGTGRPADNATVNVMTWSPTAPVAPGNGDMWVDTSVTPNVAKVRVGGAWQVASNYVTQGSDIGVANSATADITLTSFGSQAGAIAGNTFLRTAGSADFNASVRGPLMAGACVGEMDIVVGGWTIMALDTSPTTNSYGAQILYVQYNEPTGSITVLNAGNAAYSATIAAHIAGKLQLFYDKVRFRLFVGGTQYGGDITTVISPTYQLYAKWFDYSAIKLTGLAAGALPTSNLWGDVGGANVPAPNAGTSYTWASIGSTPVNITGNSGIRSAGTGDYNACMVGPGFAGTAFVSKKNNLGVWNIIALDDDRTTFAFATSKYHLEWIPGSLCTLSSNGSTTLGLPSGTIPTTATMVMLAYDGVNILIMADGAVVGTYSSVPAAQTLYPKVFAYSDGQVESDLQIGPYSDRAWSQVGGPARPEDNADVTANNLVSLSCAPAQGVAYDYTITAKTGELTRDLANFLKKGGADISSSATWSFTPSGCTITAGSNGAVTLNTVSATDAAIAVSAVYGGKTYTGRISITKRVDLPPSGGTAATAFSGSAAGTVNETAYTTPIVLGTGTMRTNGSGQARLNCTINYSAPLHKALSVNVKWQKSLMGANTWSDTTLSGTGTTATGSSGSPDDYGVEGSAVTNTFATGLTASTDYDFRLVAILVPGTGAPTTVAVEGSISGAQT